MRCGFPELASSYNHHRLQQTCFFRWWELSCLFYVQCAQSMVAILWSNRKSACMSVKCLHLCSTTEAFRNIFKAQQSDAQVQQSVTPCVTESTREHASGQQQDNAMTLVCVCVCVRRVHVCMQFLAKIGLDNHCLCLHSVFPMSLDTLLPFSGISIGPCWAHRHLRC